MFILRKSMVALTLFSFAFASSLSFGGEIKTHKFDVETKYGHTQFEVHFSEKNIKLAERLEQIAQNDLSKVINYFQYSPRDTVHINIDSNTRLTNGFARNFPTNLINLYNFPANNSEHLVVMEDWWRGLVIHEFTHIIHLDQTRGWLESGRKIFGSIAKLPVGVVPRWFTEGIAVWSESHFYKSGRLSNELFNKELWTYFKDPKSCTKIDCIDDSGKYPFGSLSYWIGAHFIDYLETQKAGTVRCLVEENSSEFPFFLDRVISVCTGRSLFENYENFKYSFIKKYQFTLDESDIVQEAFGKPVYQKGVFLDGTHFYRVEQTKLNEALVAYDLEGKVNLSQKYSYPISDISGIVKLDDENSALLVSFNDDPNYKITNKVWKLINNETLLEERVLDFGLDPSYVLPINKDEYETITYQNNLWHLKRIKFNGNERSSLFDLEFPSGDNVVLAKILKNKLILKIYNYPTDTSKLVVADLDFKEPKVVYSSQKYFDLFAVTVNGFGIKEEKNAFYFTLKDDQVLKQNLDFEKVKDTTFVIENEKFKLSLDQNLLVKKDLGLTVTSKPEVVASIPLTYEIFPDQKINAISYPELNHFKPHYWFLNYNNVDNLKSVGAFTSFADPMEVHNFSLSGNYYFDENKLGGVLNYTFNGAGLDSKNLVTTNYFDLQASQEYTKNNISSTSINQTRKLDLNFRTVIDKKRIHLIPGFFFGQENTSDFISTRRTKYLGLRGIAQYAASNYTDFFRSFSFTTRAAIDTPGTGDNFFNFQNKLVSQFKLIDEFIFEVRFSQGKLYKEDFTRGVLYGGGYSSLQTSRWFEFYGLTYSNAYGNSITTARLKLDYNVYDAYRGYELFPFYLKELHLIGGVEQLSTDVIYIDNRYFRNESISSVFAGVKAKTNILYTGPVDFEFILSSTKAPSGNNVGQGIVVINAELF